MFFLLSQRLPCPYYVRPVDNDGRTGALFGVLKADPAIENDDYSRNTLPAQLILCVMHLCDIDYIFMLYLYKSSAYRRD